MKCNVTLTDTFGGDPNYSWVKRAVIDVPDGAPQARIMRAAKEAVGMNGIRGKTEDTGSFYEFRPFGICQVMFVEEEM